MLKEAGYTIRDACKALGDFELGLRAVRLGFGF